MKFSYLCRTITILVLIILAEGRLGAQGKFGFGIILGEPTGVAWKYRMNHVNAIDGAIGFSPYDRFRINVDCLWHSYPFNEGNLALHYGLGTAMGFGRTEYIAYNTRDGYFLRRQQLGFAARGVVGLTYTIPQSPVDLFFEIAPVLIMAPESGLGVDAGLGARIYP